MMITKNDLIVWLKDIDVKLKKPITLIAIGGTAMTLLNLKESTRDVDFDVRKEDFDIFKKLSKGKFDVHISIDGYIFSEQLPDDHIILSKEYKDARFKNIKLKTLHPMDIIITKAARYNARDEEDIATLAKKVKIDKNSLVKRFEEIAVTYAGSETNFRHNFNVIHKRHFS